MKTKRERGASELLRTVLAVQTDPGRTGVELKAKARRLRLKAAEDAGLIVYRNGGWYVTKRGTP